ncbi:MAG: dockerin type I domain-containing protein [Planctomycetota bacterium]
MRFRAFLGLMVLLSPAWLVSTPARSQAQALPPVSGTTVTLDTAPQHTLFIPDGLEVDAGRVDLLVHFHGSADTVHRNAGHAGLNAAIVNVSYSGFSSAYSGPFGDPDLFGAILENARTTLAARPGFDVTLDWDAVSVSSFSAGYGAVREILKQPAYFDRIDGVLLADSLYASFNGPSDPTPRASQMAPFRAFAQAAATGDKTMIVSHSQVQTFTYANTAETADDLMQHVGVAPQAVQQDGLGTLSFYRQAELGGFSVWGASGADADAHLEHLRYLGEWLDDLPVEKTDPEPGGPLSIANFETAEAPFDYPPLYSGSNVGIATATAERVVSEAHTGAASQEIEVTKQSQAPAWMLRHTAGGGFPSNNTPLPAEGWIGLWLKTESQGVSVQIGLDDPDSADLSTLTPVVADGAWRLYQWKIDDPAQWQAWVDGDGVITGPLTTLDAIFLHGDRSATVYLDDVVVTSGSTPLGLPGDADGDGSVGLLDFDALAQRFGAPGNGSGVPNGPGEGDFNGDDAVDLLDFDLLAQNFGVSATAAVTASAPGVVPEPAGLGLLGGAVLLVVRRRPS